MATSSTAVNEEYENVLKPGVKLSVQGSSPLSGIAELRIEAEGASFVELYAVPRYGLKEMFLGLAGRVDQSRWIFKWNTADTPNGEYAIFARIKNAYGLYDSERQLLSVFNEPLILTLTNEAEELEGTNESLDKEMKTTSTEIDEHDIDGVSEVDAIATERVLEERAKDDATKDSDADGITDYDEMYIYGTDHSSADTDGDGFIDGAEILSGYNPRDNTPEALITYESPKESSIATVEYLAVESVTTDTSAVPEGGSTAAMIQGKALPNSFVTLYIYSTPIIVTVKTNDDGSWSYRFDKELDDGDHEVYVGITDNAGRIIAKSSPFPFVKTAEAFTPVDASTAPAVVSATSNDSLLSDRVTLIILSIAVVALGLVLMLLGLHMQLRPRMQSVSPA